MDKQLLSVLLVEDDPEDCAAFADYIEAIDDVHLSNVTNSAEQALEYVKDFLPDAVILDLELHQGSGSGLAFLSGLGKLQLSTIPYVLVTTSNISRVTHEHVRRLGADFIMLKNEVDYSAKYVVDFLHTLKDIIHTQGKKIPIHSARTAAAATTPAVAAAAVAATTPTATKTAATAVAAATVAAAPNEENTAAPVDERTKMLQARLSAEFDKIGINPSAVGRGYLIDAIIMTVDGEANHITLSLAQKYHKTYTAIERSMQYAINRAWMTSDIDDLEQYYTARINSDRGMPTLNEFIFYYANKLKLEY